MPYKGAKPSAAEHDTARDVMEEDREEVGDEEQREESDRELEADAVSIHLPKEEELWVNCVANHPTRPRWVTAESERKIVQLMGVTGTRCTGCGVESSSRKSLKKHVTTHIYVYLC